MKKSLNLRSFMTCLLATAVTIGGGLALNSCSEFDDSALKESIDGINGRVTSLEEAAATRNSDINALKEAVAALQGQKAVSRTEVITENNEEVGHTIHFTDGTSIDIYHGTNDGNAPVFGVQEISGVYYWTVSLDGGAPELLKDGAGNNVPATGADGAAGTDAIAPQVRIDPIGNTSMWQISTDGGQTWVSTDVVAKGTDGDSMFSALDLTTDPTAVILTTADGTTTIRLPRAAALAFATPGTFLVTNSQNEMDITLPGAWQNVSHALTATLVNTDGSAFTAIHTRVGEDVEIIAPDFTGEGAYDGPIKVKINATGTFGEKAILRFTLIDGASKEHTIARVVEFQPSVDVNSVSALTEALSDGEVAVTLTQDIEVTEAIALTPETKSINLAGKTLTAPKGLKFTAPVPTRAAATTAPEIVIKGGTIISNSDTERATILCTVTGAKLTLEDVTIKNTSAAKDRRALYIGGLESDGLESTDITLVVKNSTIEAVVPLQVINKGHNIVIENSVLTSTGTGATMTNAITQNGLVPGSTFTLTNCTISAEATAIYLSNLETGDANTLTMTGCTVTSTKESAVEVKKTHLMISGGTLRANATSQSYTFAGGGTAGIGYGVVLAGHAGAEGVAYNIDPETGYKSIVMPSVKFELGTKGSIFSPAVQMFVYRGENVPAPAPEVPAVE